MQTSTGFLNGSVVRHTVRVVLLTLVLCNPVLSQPAPDATFLLMHGRPAAQAHLLPTRAAGEDSVAPSPRVLTLNGRPLSRLLHAATTWEPVSRTNVPTQEGGQISGIAFGCQRGIARGPRAEAAERSWAGHRDAGGRHDAHRCGGGVSFTALRQGRYVVDVLRGDQIVTTSGPIALAAGGMTFIPGISVCLPRMAPLYTREPPSPRDCVRRTIVQVGRPSPQPALACSGLEVCASREFLRHRSSLVSSLCQAGVLALAARQPAGTGSAQIRWSIAPNRRRVRWLSASSSQ